MDTILREKIRTQTRLLDPTNWQAMPGEIALFLREAPFVRQERSGCSHPLDKHLCNAVSINDLCRHGVIGVPGWARNARGYVVVRSFSDESLGTVAHSLEDALREADRFWMKRLRCVSQQDAGRDRLARRSTDTIRTVATG